MLCLDLRLNEIQLNNYALIEIEKILQDNETTLRNISNKLCPDELLVRDGGNKLIMEELMYDKEAMCVEHEKLYSCLMCEQKSIYDDIISGIALDKGGVFFL